MDGLILFIRQLGYFQPQTFITCAGDLKKRDTPIDFKDDKFNKNIQVFPFYVHISTLSLYVTISYEKMNVGRLTAPV